MSLARNVYEHVIQQVDGSATLNNVVADVDELLPATMTRDWYVQHTRVNSEGTRWWDSDHELREYSESFHNRNRRETQFGAMSLYARNSSRGGSYRAGRRLANTGSSVGAAGVMTNAQDKPIVMIWYEHDNPCDAPALLADAPDGVIAGWSFDEPTDEPAERVRAFYSGGSNEVRYPVPAEMQLMQSWADTLDLLPVIVDGNVVAWVAPEDWRFQPNLSQRFFMSALSISGSGHRLPQWLLTNGYLKADTPTPEAEYDEEQITIAADIIRHADAALGSVRRLRSSANERITRAERNVVLYRDRAEQYQRSHASSLSDMREQEREVEEARAALATVDPSSILNRFDAVESIVALNPIHKCEMDERGYIVSWTHPLNLRGASRSEVCDECRDLGRAEPREDCDHCHSSGWRTVRIDPLKITINPSSYAVSVANERGSSYPHPHVNSPDPCWGAAGTAINSALDSQDYVNAMHMILGWAVTYSAASPYNPITEYETTDGDPGWVIPEEG